MTNTYMPINISIQNRKCLVIGGGKIALRKIETLLDYECTDITVIAPEAEGKIAYHAQRGLLKWEKRAYQSPEASHYGIVISATDDPKINQKVWEDTRQSGALVNVVDNPKLCDFIFPAVVKRDCLSLSISTDGKAPFLGKHLRLILDGMFQEHWKKIARLASQFRDQVHARYAKNPEKKMTCFYHFLNADWKTLIKEKDDTEIAQLLESFLE